MADNDKRDADPWTSGPRQPAPGAAGGEAGGGGKAEGWEREVLGKLAGAALTEQRRGRRWGIFFKLLGFAYIGFSLFLVWRAMEPQHFDTEKGRHTAVIDIEGTIAAGEQASASQIIAGLSAAYEDADTAGIILRINSPGGSPVQAGAIYDELRRQRELHPDVPVYAVLGDVCASGGYYVAAAAQRIYADKASIVGSIGVRMDGFGFVEAMRELGVERRLLTAGENKGLLDPFSPQDPEVTAHLQSLLERIHLQFIDAVRSGRGERLRDSEELFSGLIWTGDESLSHGLVDALGSDRYVAREVIGVERMVNFTPREDLITRFAERVGATLFRLFEERGTPQLRH